MAASPLLEMLVGSQHETMASVRASFAEADTDSSGSLSHAELTAVLKRICPDLTPDALKVAIEIFDDNGDGQITIDEFLSAVERYVDGETTVDKAIQLTVEARASSLLTRTSKAILAWLDANQTAARGEQSRALIKPSSNAGALSPSFS